MMAGRERLRPGRSGMKHRTRKKRYLVVTNGEVTERQYFMGLNDELEDAVITVRCSRNDPAALASYAKTLKKLEDAACAGRASDGFRSIFVVTDVDEFTLEQFRKASRICRAQEMRLIISNPCFEVWLIDHVQVCPEAFSSAAEVQRKAEQLGLVGGSHSKEIASGAIRGRRKEACHNASVHNDRRRRRQREELASLEFSPWTDMPDVLTIVDKTSR